MKSGQGIQAELCAVEEISTSGLIKYGLIAFFAIFAAIIFFRAKKNGNFLEAAAISASPVTIAVGSLLTELIDFVGDALACYNVFKSSHPGVASESRLYLVLLLWQQWLLL